MNAYAYLFLYWAGVNSLSFDSKGFDDTVLYKIDWPGNVVAPFVEDKFEPLVVTTSDQEKFRCMIPNTERKEEAKKSVETGLSPLHFLSPIFSSSSCTYRIEAYWAYEICHGHHVKQYHEERDGKNIKVQEYYLGKWNKEKMTKLAVKLKEEQESGRKFKTTKIDNVKYPYLEMEMTDGTICDLNNEPRVTRVRYVCYPHRKNEIYSLKETSTCNYEAIILTSVLCMHAEFLPEDSTENLISCLPVGNGPEKPLSWLHSEIDNIKIRFEQIADVFRPRENIAIIKVDPKDGSVRMDFINVDQDDAVTNFEQFKASEEAPVSTLPKSTPSTVKDTSPVDEFLEGKNCLTGGTGWWKYEFCYGRYVRQFHIDKVGETSVILGFFNEKMHKEWLEKNPEKTPKLKQRTEISHLYQGGSICDKTSKMRQVEVKLKCLLNVPSPATVQMYLLEPKTCQYILVVESPIICNILQVADEYGLVHRKLEKLDHSKDAESVFIENVEELEVRYEND